MEKLRWGIMGSGKIPYRWINGAMQVPEMEITAVAGRTRDKVDKLAAQYNIKNRYYSYADIARSDEVDVLYVATPHAFHKELAIMAMNHGKHVLVEKPIAVSAQEAQEMIACAEANNVFLMEAVWTRFFPAIDLLHTWLADGTIGQVRSVHAAFSTRVPVDKASRLFDPAQAGGSLLDVGVYPLHFSDIVYDRAPHATFGYAAIGTDEHALAVDEQATYIAQYDDGATAVMSSGIRTDMPDTAVIYTTDARITFPIFWKPTKMEVVYYDPNRADETIDMPVALTNPDYIDEGFQYEIRHMCAGIRDGLTQSPVMTHEKSLAIMRQCDTLRGLWGLTYPFEQ